MLARVRLHFLNSTEKSLSIYATILKIHALKHEG